MRYLIQILDFFFFFFCKNYNLRNSEPCQLSLNYISAQEKIALPVRGSLNEDQDFGTDGFCWHRCHEEQKYYRPHRKSFYDARRQWYKMIKC